MRGGGWAPPADTHHTILDQIILYYIILYYIILYYIILYYIILYYIILYYIILYSRINQVEKAFCFTVKVVCFHCEKGFGCTAIKGLVFL